MSKWKIASNIIGDTKMYIAYRLRDEAEVDHSGNREYSGDYTAEFAEVERLVAELNKEG